MKHDEICLIHALSLFEANFNMRRRKRGYNKRMIVKELHKKKRIVLK